MKPSSCHTPLKMGPAAVVFLAILAQAATSYGDYNTPVRTGPATEIGSDGQAVIGGDDALAYQRGDWTCVHTADRMYDSGAFKERLCRCVTVNLGEGSQNDKIVYTLVFGEERTCPIVGVAGGPAAGGANAPGGAAPAVPPAPAPNGGGNGNVMNPL